MCLEQKSPNIGVCLLPCNGKKMDFKNLIDCGCYDPSICPQMSLHKHGGMRNTILATWEDRYVSHISNQGGLQSVK